MMEFTLPCYVLVLMVFIFLNWQEQDHEIS